MKNTIKLFILVAFFMLSAYPAHACVTTLTWDPPTEGGTPEGYWIYYATSAGIDKNVESTYIDKIKLEKGKYVTEYLLSEIPMDQEDTTYYFRVSAYNTVGESEELSNEVEYYNYSDGIAPSIAITSPSISPYETDSSTITISGTASDNYEVSTVIWVLSSSSSSGTASGTTSWTASSIPLESGTNTITVTAYDCAGNSATETLTVIYDVDEDTTTEETVTETDSEAPVVVIASPSSNGSYTTESGAVTLSGSASDNVGISTITWENTEKQTSGTAYGTISWSIPVIALKEGTNTIAVSATDSAGNTSSAFITVTYNVTETTAETTTETATETVSGDTTKPNVTITLPTERRYYRSRSSVVDLAGIASDNVGVTTVIWVNQANGAAGTATGTTNWSVPGIELDIGRNIITITAYDEAGNSSTDKIMVTRRR